MREDSRNYVIVGSFVLAMLVALITWIALLSGRTGATDDYHVVYDNVMGLKTGVEILYEGYPVGLIEGISPVEQDGRRRYRVDVSVERGWPIPDDSRATITAPGLLSGFVIDIEAGESSTLLEPDDEIPGEEAADMFAVVNEVGEKLQPLLENLAQTTPEILANVETFTTELNRTVEQINTLLDPTNVGYVKRILVNLDSTTSDFAAVANDLNRTRGQVDDLIERLDEMLDAKNGEVGQAMVDLNHTLGSVARHIDAITSNLETTTRNMNEFSRQIRENPGVIIRGREADGDAGGSN
jgi:phospholipid/cholesterol/gamma-HCH transport system substrate-binding protein